MANKGPESFFHNLTEHMDEVFAVLNSLVSTCGFPVYTSLDIRDAGWKICAVDVNLFPAGFNNLTIGDRTLGSQKMREFFSAKLLSPPPWNICVVPEAHTTNQGYLENLSGIIKLLEEAGAKVKLLWPGPPIPKPWEVTTRAGDKLTYLPAPMALEGSQALLLNHDLSGGIPAAIKDVNLPTFPSTKLGWFRRRKSTHQEIIDGILKKIQSQVNSFDPWYFSTESRQVTEINFDDKESIRRLHEEATLLWKSVKENYEKRGINEKARIFLKNDAGTYGLGVMSLEHPDDILSAGSRLKNKMRKGKEFVPVTQVILQETIPTCFVYRNKAQQLIAGEPVLYMVNGLPIGGFMRIHENLGDNAAVDNLNQPGSILEPLDCTKATQSYARPFPTPRGKSPCSQFALKESYGFIARLHAVAAGLEDCPK